MAKVYDIASPAGLRVMEFAELAEELNGAIKDHETAFREFGYCEKVAEANRRIGKVHLRYAEMSGQYWRDGNERLLSELLTLASPTAISS